ncbi:MAG: hypothetical protein U9Q67_04035 [Patescibacteria group bacterium]|nr:hypothetical protein [Patescibacteria group bacterium]
MKVKTRNTLVFAFLGLLVSGLCMPVLAQNTDDGSAVDQSDGDEDVEVEDSVDLFTVEASIGDQSVRTGEISLSVDITPSIDSSNAQVVWDLPRGLSTSDDIEQWFEMNSDEQQTFTINVKPENSGTYKIVVDVTAWRYDTNYVSSDQLNLEINNDLLLSPVTEEYNKRLVMYNVAKIAVGLIGLGLLGLSGKHIYKMFRKWLVSD